jgi:membrane protein implicated in regulation of membrane protease activity
MLEFAQSLQWWHWWIAAAVLAAAETFLPGAIAIWFAAAAVAVGALLLIVPVPWQLQLVLFGVLGIAAVFLWRRYRFDGANESTQRPLNQRGLHYVGQEFTLIEALSGGSGKIQVGDTVWLVNGADAPVGARVRVVGVNGAVLRVERATQAT